MPVRFPHALVLYILGGFKAALPKLTGRARLLRPPYLRYTARIVLGLGAEDVDDEVPPCPTVYGFTLFGGGSLLLFSLLAFFNFISLPSEIRAFCELVLGPLLSRRPPSWRPSSWRFLLGGFGLYLAASLLGPRSRVSVAGVPFSPRSQCTVTVFTLNL